MKAHKSESVNEIHSEADSIDESRIFARKFPILGWIPIGFYIPDCPSKYELRRLIEKHGGIVIKYEAFTYQIKPEKECNDSRKFYTGNIYSSKWIKACIKRGRFIEDNDTYCLGFNRNYELKTITKKRTAYTIIEVLKMFDLAKKDIDYSSRSVKFWDEVEKKNIIPDRTSQSLRTAWRKFSKYGEEQFIREALKDKKVRFSHQFEAVPYLSTHSKPKYVSGPSSVAESNQEIDQPLDMEVMSREATEEPPEEDDLEFLLAIEDLQSAIAFNATDDRTYSLKAPKRNGNGSLHIMFDNRDDKLRKEERKRVSNTFETPEKSENGGETLEVVKKITFEKDDDFLKADSTNIYNQDELFDFLTKDFKITLHRDPKSNELSVKSKVVQKAKDHFFEKLSRDLRDLAKEYGKEMDEMHMLFMEVSCDLGELRNLLKGEKAPKWSMLEDLAIQSEPESVEYKHICDSKGGNQVSKRRKFLELQG